MSLSIMLNNLIANGLQGSGRGPGSGTDPNLSGGTEESKKTLRIGGALAETNTGHLSNASKISDLLDV